MDLIYILSGGFACTMCAMQIYYMAKLVNVLSEIRDERALIAQINDGEKWV